VPFITARNWSAVVVSILAGLVSLLDIAGLVPANAALIVLIVVLGISLRFSYLVTRTALEVPVGMAIPIVIMDFLLSILIQAAFLPFAAASPSPG
jgi:hypothetical protein